MARITGGATILIATATATCGLLALNGFGPAASGSEQLPVVAPTDPTTETTQPDAESTTSTSTTTSSTTTTVVSSTGVPTSVTASNTIVGAGGVVTFDGTCDVDGPVFVQITGRSTVTVDTSEKNAIWSFDWTAPVDDADIGTSTFRFFCGDPADFTGSYPAELEQRVDMVAVAAPTTIDQLAESDPPIISILPETR